MTIGILASRYAKAFYGYAIDNNEELVAYEAMKNVAYQFLHLPELKLYLSNPVVSRADKIGILEKAAGGNVSPCVTHFFEFLFTKGKQEYLLYIAVAFQHEYRKAKGMILAQLETAQPAADEMLYEIQKLVQASYNNTFSIEMETRINPKLIGGFRLTVDGRQLDASVRGQLFRIKKAVSQ